MSGRGIGVALTILFALWVGWSLARITDGVQLHAERVARCRAEATLYRYEGGAAAAKLASLYADGGPDADCVIADALRAAGDDRR